MAKPKRPLIVTLFALVNLLFGSAALGLAGMMIYLNYGQFAAPPAVAPDQAPDDPPPAGAGRPRMAAPAAMRPPGEKDPGPRAQRPIPDSDWVAILKQQQKQFAGQVDYYDLYSTGAVLAGLVLGVLFLGSSLGLFLLNPAGRRLSLAVALLAPLAAAGAGYVGWTKVRPELQRWERNRNDLIEKEFREPRPDNTYEKRAVAAGMGGVAGTAVYSLLLFVGMLLPTVRTAFRWRRATAPAPADGAPGEPLAAPTPPLT